MFVKNALKVAGILIVLLLIVKLFNLAIPLEINTTTTARSGEFAVTGTGKVEMIPDTANISAGITVTNVRTTKEAETKISDINNKIVNSLKKLGIQKEDIKTSNFSINPEYDYQTYRPEVNRIKGYSGNAGVTIKVKDTKLAPQVIDAVTQAGANNVSVSNFTIENPEKFKEEARDKAIKNAKDQATKLAKSLGIKLGRVVNLVESSDGGYPPPYYSSTSYDAKQMGGEQRPAPDIQPGSQTINSTVTLYFQTR